MDGGLVFRRTGLSQMAGDATVASSRRAPTSVSARALLSRVAVSAQHLHCGGGEVWGEDLSRGERQGAQSGFFFSRVI